MEGALTQLRRHRARALALREIRDAELPPAEEARRVAPLAVEAGFAEALPLLVGRTRRDAADAALASLSRVREINVRVLLQAGLAVVFVAGLAYIGAPVTRLCAALAAAVALPTWVFVLGAPRGLADAVLALPVAGKPARDMAQARSVSVFALFLGAGADPPLARGIAAGHTGTPVSDAALQRVFSPGGAFGNRQPLGESSEAALLRGVIRLIGASQIRLRLLLMGIATIALVTLFVPAFRDQARRFAEPDHDREGEKDRPASLLERPATGSTGD